MGLKIGFVIVLFSLLIIVESSSNINTPKNEEYVEEKKGSVSEMVKGIFSISTSSPFTSKYWEKVRALFHQAGGYFSQPNLDFRKGENAEGNEGMGEKVKDAVVKSMGKTKETIQNSAEEAANVVGVKRKEDDQSEL